MQNLLKNKLLVIISIFVLLLTNFTNVFAGYQDTFTDIVPNNSTTMFESWLNGLSEYKSGNYYYFATCVYKSSTWKKLSYIEFIPKSYFDNPDNKVYIDYSGGYFYLYYTNPVTTCGYVDGGAGKSVSPASRTQIYYKINNHTVNEGIATVNFETNIPIIYKGNTEISFFPEPPPIVEEPTATMTLVEILEQEKEQVATLKEVLQILPLIIVVVVSLVGLRKALKVLLELLRNS